VARKLDDLDTRLLGLVQAEVPLVRRPFAVLAERLGVPEAEVLQRLSALAARPGPVIRQISAIFDSRALGYQSTLVAARIEPERLDAAVEVLNAHPGISHNYERNHAFNVWYTLAVPPHSKLGLACTVDLLHQLSGAQSTRMLPTLRLFKIGVQFDLSGGDLAAARTGGPAFGADDQAAALAAGPVTVQDRGMIRILQRHLPIVAEPFDALAAEGNVEVEDLLAAGRRFLGQKRMRRYAAVLRHREAGISANAMGVWEVPDGQREAFGRTAASFAAVSHCYERPTYPDWPYSIFTMVHAPTPGECEAVLAALAAATGTVSRVALYSTREFKKTRVQYFAGDIEAWEKAHWPIPADSHAERS
jgi:DNA-binding Lrp family transcriptional regulator